MNKNTLPENGAGVVAKDQAPLVAAPSDEEIQKARALQDDQKAGRKLVKPNGDMWLNEAKGVSYRDDNKKAPIGFTNSPCTLVAVLERADGGHKARWSFHHRWGGAQTLAVTTTEDWAAAARELSRAGLYISEQSSRTGNLFPDYLNTAFSYMGGSVPHIAVIERGGWVNQEFTAFAFFGELIAANDEIESRYVLDLPEAKRLSVRKQGTLALWKEKVARTCKDYSRLLSCAIMSALFGPLNRVLLTSTNTNPIFFLVGHSGTGKTTALEVASSVFGVRRISLAGSTKGLEGYAALCNDLYFAGDEIQTAQKKVQPIIYLLGNGDSGAYLNRSRELAASEEFCCSAGFAGEQSVMEIMLEQANQVALDGGSVRCLGVPIDESRKAPDGVRLLGVFDRCPDGEKNAEGVAGRLNAALKSECYGVAGEEFIRKLVKEIGARPDGLALLRKEAETYTAKFKERVADCGPFDDVPSRALNSFAAYAYAGFLGVRFGVLPWPEDYPAEAVEYAFRRWMGREDSKAQILRKAAEALASPELSRAHEFTLETHNPPMKPSYTPSSISTATVLTWQGETAAVIYTPQRFREICKQAGIGTAADVVEYLLSVNALITNRPGGNNPSMRGKYTLRGANRLEMSKNASYYIVSCSAILSDAGGLTLDRLKELIGKPANNTGVAYAA